MQNLGQYFSTNGYAFDIIHDKKLFGMSHKILSSKKKDLKKQGKGTLPNKAALIEDSYKELNW